LTSPLTRYLTLAARAAFLIVSIGPLLVALMVIAQASETPNRLPSEQVIVSTGAAEVAFSTELATNDEDRSIGLMHRRSLGEREAMLFYWQEQSPVSMWMRNTFIPLDMLFVDRDGTVVHVAANTVPQSLEIISAGRPVSAVMEINAGIAARFNIVPGSRLIHRFFSRS
jgi:uncharacterized membrane protein (UPF0127 family)